MIQQVVESILEAEDSAKQMIAKAEEQATIIMQDARKSVELLNQESLSNAKQFVAKNNTSANVKAEQMTAQLVDEGNRTVEEEMDGYSRNTYKAVAYVMEQIL